MASKNRFRPSSRLRDTAIVIPVGGIILFLPPYIQVFDQTGYVFGVPYLHIFLFAAWGTGIALTAIVARKLVKSDIGGDANPPSGNARFANLAPGITNRTGAGQEEPAP